VTDLSNRRFGTQGARRVVYVGFVLAVALSVILATPRIAIASGAAFLVAQLLDISIFARLRDRAWWMPPFISSVISSGLDTAIFFSFAFYCGALPGLGLTISDVLGQAGIADECIALPWVNLAVADYLVKLALAAISIAPYGAILTLMHPRLQRTA
jgi:queuosine precursor transporter